MWRTHNPSSKQDYTYEKKKMDSDDFFHFNWYKLGTVQQERLKKLRKDIPASFAILFLLGKTI